MPGDSSPTPHGSSLGRNGWRLPCPVGRVPNDPSFRALRGISESLSCFGVQMKRASSLRCAPFGMTKQLKQSNQIETPYSWLLAQHSRMRSQESLFRVISFFQPFQQLFSTSLLTLPEHRSMFCVTLRNARPGMKGVQQCRAFYTKSAIPPKQ
jgi:hypothetical protein